MIDNHVKNKNFSNNIQPTRIVNNVSQEEQDEYKKE